MAIENSEKRRVLITGASGFLGKHLSRRLKLRGDVDVIELKSNLLNFDEIESEIKSLSNNGGFRACFHFAGISSVPDCEANVYKAYAINTTGAIALAEIIAKNNPGCHFIFPSSGQLYKASSDPNAVLSEDSDIETKSSYSRSKFLAEQGLKLISNNLNLSVTILRLFNHSHKSQDPRFFIPSIYHQILKVKQESKKEIILGNTDLVRDVGSLSDLLEAFLVLFDDGPRGRMNLYNICSGSGKKLDDIAKELISRFDNSIKIYNDKSLFRVGEAQSLVGVPNKFIKDYGWQPKFAQSVRALVDSFLKDEI